MRKRSVLILVASLVLFSCSDGEQGPGGVSGSSGSDGTSGSSAGCTVTTAGYDVTITCSDGTSATLRKCEHDNDLDEGGRNKTYVCHSLDDYNDRPRSIKVSPNALPMHLSHGDYSGKCGQ